MSYVAPRLRAWMSLDFAEAFRDLAAERGVSEEARSSDGFMGIYNRVNGNKEAMKDQWYSETYNWFDRRNDFVNRHMAQVERRNESLFEDDGSPSRRHLALIMWAYTPEPQKLRAWLNKQGRTNNPGIPTAPFVRRQVMPVAPIPVEAGFRSAMPELISELPRTVQRVGNPTYAPERYFTGLSPRERRQRMQTMEEKSALHWDDPEAYEPWETDQGVKTKPSLYTSAFHERYSNRTPNKASPTEVGLRNKSRQTGIPYDIVKEVFDRGVAAWRTGHRPGTTPEQWGYARVNSFAVGGKTYWTTDADQARKLPDKVKYRIEHDPEYDGAKKKRKRNPLPPMIASTQVGLRVENPSSYIKKRTRQIAEAEGSTGNKRRMKEIEDRLEYLWDQAKYLAAEREQEGEISFKEAGDFWAYTTQIFKASQPPEWRVTEV